MQHCTETLAVNSSPPITTICFHTLCMGPKDIDTYCEHYCSVASKYCVSISCVENPLSGSTCLERGTVVVQWLGCCSTNRKVTGSIPAGVSGFFIGIKSFRLHYGPGVDSASNRNVYQEYILGVKAAGA